MATVAELKIQAKELGIKGYSKMLKSDLEIAIAEKTIGNVVNRMTNSRRTENYYQQNGCDRLTPRQRRRVIQKERAHAGQNS